MNLVDLVRRVTDFTLANHDERDCWMKAPVISAVLQSGKEKNIAIVDSWLRRAVATQRTNGNLAYADTYQGITSGHIRSFTTLASLTASLGYPLMLRYRQRSEADLLEAAHRQYVALRAAPRTRDGGICARAEGPELWIDYTYLMCPFLALYGITADKPDAIEEAFLQFRVHVSHLVDPAKKLARHAWCESPDHFPQSTFWSRGNGWLVCASVDLLELVPAHRDADFVREVGVTALKAMASYQDSSGYFCHVLDDPRSNLEASGGLMFAYAVGKAARLGLDVEELMPSAVRAFSAVAGGVEPTGKVPGVAVPPGGPGVPFDWAPFGQGFFLLAANELAARLTK